MKRNANKKRIAVRLSLVLALFWLVTIGAAWGQHAFGTVPKLAHYNGTAIALEVFSFLAMLMLLAVGAAALYYKMRLYNFALTVVFGLIGAFLPQVLTEWQRPLLLIYALINLLGLFVFQTTRYIDRRADERDHLLEKQQWAEEYAYEPEASAMESPVEAGIRRREAFRRFETNALAACATAFPERRGMGEWARSNGEPPTA